MIWAGSGSFSWTLMASMMGIKTSGTGLTSLVVEVDDNIVEDDAVEVNVVAVDAVEVNTVAIDAVEFNAVAVDAVEVNVVEIDVVVTASDGIVNDIVKDSFFSSSSSLFEPNGHHDVEFFFWAEVGIGDVDKVILSSK